MGRIAKHTQEEVFQVADELAGEGVDVTPTVLRTRLGGGSYGTICDHLSAWKAARTAKPAPLVIEMPEAARAAFAAVWSAVSAEAGKLVTEARERAAAEVAEVKQQLADARGNIDRLEAEVDEEAGVIEGVKRELDECQQAAAAAATASTERVAKLTTTIEQLEKQKDQQVEGLRAELDQAREEAAAASRDAGAAVEKRDQALDSLTKGQQALDAAVARERDLIARLASTTAHVERLEEKNRDDRAMADARMGDLESQRKGLDVELKAARAEAKQAAAATARSEGELEALRVRVKEQSELLKKLTPASPRKG